MKREGIKIIWNDRENRRRETVVAPEKERQAMAIIYQAGGVPHTIERCMMR